MSELLQDLANFLCDLMDSDTTGQEELLSDKIEAYVDERIKEIVDKRMIEWSHQMREGFKKEHDFPFFYRFPVRKE